MGEWAAFDRFLGERDERIFHVALASASLSCIQCHHRESITGAKVLELGTGTGIVGISVASMGANVVVTD
eukprot:1331609-Amorphochlora_amoeboformis.AAC.2